MSAAANQEHVRDVVIIGAGVLGLAHAYLAARAGRRVTVLERDAWAQGASVRNFGMVWPIGQPPGDRLDTALRSRARWLEALDACDAWHHTSGSLHLAYDDDEWAVLAEFAERAGDHGYSVELLGPDAVKARSPAVRVGTYTPRGDHLRGGLYSTTEVGVDPPAVIAALAAWIDEQPGCEVRFGHAVSAIEAPRVHTPHGVFAADEIIVCSGAETALLFPQQLSGLRRCKLQMMATGPQPGGFRLGPMLAAGLTLTHYESFAACATLPALRERLIAQYPDHARWGIHVMVSQTQGGELVIGDSHEYDADVTPYDDPAIDHAILSYLDTFFAPPGDEITRRWHGIYVKHPTAPWLRAHPQPGVTLLTGFGGAGMTFSFGVAEQTFSR